ncbi:MAG: hypothetical protein LBN39_10905 [Planctomycetaceae bacterium]|jgi:hypothetical protein|nr:hypothetical protein [Planctomycetaceae bacterium]
MASDTRFLLEHLQKDVRFLADKYSVAVPNGAVIETDSSSGITVAGIQINTETDSGFVPLFPWRYERRFIELKRIVETATIENVVLCRFSNITDGRAETLPDILYKEFDILEFLTGEKIVSLFASTVENKFANVVVRLSNGTLASVEAGTTLPAGHSPLDRHELIARRGVASDRVVDTHIPQQSVYVFGKDSVQSYTDTDSELFGLQNEEINLVRAAFEWAKNQQTAAAVEQHQRLVTFVKQATLTNP